MKDRRKEADRGDQGDDASPAEATGPEFRVRGGIRERSAGDLEILGDGRSVEAYLTAAFASCCRDRSRSIRADVAEEPEVDCWAIGITCAV